MRRTDIDRLALLCTLHADGPRTLRLLREVGCYSIQDLTGIPPEEISGVLSMPPAAARRLTREALRLAERLDPELEMEEVTYPSARVPSRSPALSRVLESQEDPLQRLDLRDRELLSRVVGTGAPVEQDRSPAPKPQVDRKRAELLRPEDIEGLDTAVCSALAVAGVSTLEELTACSVEELVNRAGMPFTQARALQWRAGKRLGETRSTPTVIQDRMSPRDAPTLEPEPCTEDELDTEPSFVIPRPGGPDGSGAAGPFA